MSLRTRSSDDGFTLVELVVSLTILAVGIVGVIGVTNSSFRVAGTASARSKMVSAATQEVESLRAIPYAEIGADRDGNGSPDCGTVAVSASGQWSCYLDDPNRTSANVKYRMQRTIQDAPDLITSDNLPADKHKEVLITVSWSDSSGYHEVRQSSYLYPGGIGLATAGSTTTVVSNCTPDQPSSLTVSQITGGTALQSSTQLDLAWTITTNGCPVASYVIQYKRITDSVWNEVSRIATSREYRVTGLTAATTYQFQVFSKAPGGKLSSGSPTVSAATAAAIGATCTIGTITVTPSAIKKANNSPTGNLDQPAVVSMPTNGTCSNFDVVYKKTLAGTTTSAQMSLSNNIHTGSISVLGPWDVGSRYIDVVERSTRAKVGTVLFVVCENNVKECA